MLTLALLPCSVMRGAMNRISLAGLRRRRERLALNGSPLLASISAPRSDQFVFPRNRSALPWL